MLMRALRLTPRAGDLAKGEFDLSSAIAFYRTFLKEIPDLAGWTEKSKRSSPAGPVTWAGRS